jgi:hypothetical protein
MRHGRTITAVALAVLMAGLFALEAPSSAATRHTHLRNHHARLHFDSHPGPLTAAKSKVVSQNWSGYVARGGKFTTVSGSWTVPNVDCSSTPTGVVALWVGLDGSGSHTVEQTGTFSACDHGAVQYAAWYEAFPAPSVTLPNPVGAGDSMSATVTNTGPQTFQLVLTNNSQGWTSTNNIQVRGRLASAEAIVEAPSLHGEIVPLANFGSTGFSNVTANGNPLGSAKPIPITMASSGGVVKAAPGPIGGGASP